MIKYQRAKLNENFFSKPLRAGLLTDEQYGKDSKSMMIQLQLIESILDINLKNIHFDRELWLQQLEHFNLGRELLDRGFIKMFFGDGPKGINTRIRKALFQQMLIIDMQYPVLKGEKFDDDLKKHMEKIF